jgi:hypothetical protein
MTTKTNLLNEMIRLRDLATDMVKAIESEDWDAAYDCGAEMCYIDIIGTEQQIQGLQEGDLTNDSE